MTKLDQVKRKIIATLPDVYKPSFDLNIETFPITLEDVLAALEKKRHLSLYHDAAGRTLCFTVAFSRTPGACWLLREPLDKQSPELIEFLLNNL